MLLLKDMEKVKSQRREMLKNAQTIVQLHSFHANKVVLSSMWTDSFPMNKLDLEKAEEPEIKLPTFIGIPEKYLPLLHWLC